jgi:ribonuclease-3
LNEQGPPERKQRRTDGGGISCPDRERPGHEDPTEVEQRLACCQLALGYAFASEDLLLQALRHASSAAHPLENYERLEFLGDAILDLHVSEMLYHRHPDWREGQLTEVRSRSVNRSTLAEIGDRLGLNGWIVTGPGMAKRGRLPASVTAAALEAILGAVYLDGGPDATREVVTRVFGPVVNAAAEGAYDQNFKAKLQEFAQGLLGKTPTFEVVRSEGPEHGKTFHVSSRIDGWEVGRGRGRSKKEAEQAAAQDALEKLTDPLTP